jgi:hypothetical protein
MEILTGPHALLIAAAARLGAAGLGGLAVGIERQWSGHARAHFASVRTTLVSLEAREKDQREGAE